jgi:hypothetical protein
MLLERKMQRSKRGVGDTKLEDESNYGKLTWGGTESQENEPLKHLGFAELASSSTLILQFLSVVIFMAQRT